MAGPFAFLVEGPMFKLVRGDTCALIIVLLGGGGCKNADERGKSRVGLLGLGGSLATELASLAWPWGCECWASAVCSVLICVSSIEREWMYKEPLFH